jgi:hypothetical protein
MNDLFGPFPAAIFGKLESRDCREGFVRLQSCRAPVPASEEMAREARWLALDWWGSAPTSADFSRALGHVRSRVNPTQFLVFKVVPTPGHRQPARLLVIVPTDVYAEFGFDPFAFEDAGFFEFARPFLDKPAGNTECQPSFGKRPSSGVVLRDSKESKADEELVVGMPRPSPDWERYVRDKFLALPLERRAEVALVTFTYASRVDVTGLKPILAGFFEPDHAEWKRPDGAVTPIPLPKETTVTDSALESKVLQVLARLGELERRTGEHTTEPKGLDADACREIVRQELESVEAETAAGSVRLNKVESQLARILADHDSKIPDPAKVEAAHGLARLDAIEQQLAQLSAFSEPPVTKETTVAVSTQESKISEVLARLGELERRTGVRATAPKGLGADACREIVRQELESVQAEAETSTVRVNKIETQLARMLAGQDSSNFDRAEVEVARAGLARLDAIEQQLSQLAAYSEPPKEPFAKIPDRRIAWRVIVPLIVALAVVTAGSGLALWRQGAIVREHEKNISVLRGQLGSTGSLLATRISKLEGQVGGGGDVTDLANRIKILETAVGRPVDARDLAARVGSLEVAVGGPDSKKDTLYGQLVDLVAKVGHATGQETLAARLDRLAHVVGTEESKGGFVARLRELETAVGGSNRVAGLSARLGKIESAIAQPGENGSLVARLSRLEAAIGRVPRDGTIAARLAGLDSRVGQPGAMGDLSTRLGRLEIAVDSGSKKGTLASRMGALEQKIDDATKPETLSARVDRLSVAVGADNPKVGLTGRLTTLEQLVGVPTETGSLVARVSDLETGSHLKLQGSTIEGRWSDSSGRCLVFWKSQFDRLPRLSIWVLDTDWILMHPLEREWSIERQVVQGYVLLTVTFSPSEPLRDRVLHDVSLTRSSSRQAEKTSDTLDIAIEASIRAEKSGKKEVTQFGVTSVRLARVPSK